MVRWRGAAVAAALLAAAAAEEPPQRPVEAEALQTARLAQLERENARLQEELAAAKAELEIDRSKYPDLMPQPPSPTPPPAKVGPVRLPQDQLDLVSFGGVMLLITCLFSLPYTRCCYRRCETRRHKVMPCLLVINIGLFVWSLSFLMYVDFNTVFFAFVKFIEILLDAVRMSLTGVMAIVGLFVAWKLKDRVLAVLGIEHSGMLVGDFRDWATCWSMRRFHPIEIYVLKAEDLPSANLSSSNSVYCEAALGYDVEMRTRVHNAVGHRCIFKETMQLNFDPYDTASRLKISLKHQGILSTEISSVQIGAAMIRREEEEQQRRARGRRAAQSTAARVDAAAWDIADFKAFDMVPAGTIWLRFETVPVEQPIVSWWDCCCGWLFSRNRGADQLSEYKGGLLVQQA